MVRQIAFPEIVLDPFQRETHDFSAGEVEINFCAAKVRRTYTKRAVLANLAGRPFNFIVRPDGLRAKCEPVP